MNKKHLTEAEQQELLLRMKKNYTYDAKSGRLTSSRYGRAIRGKKLGKKGYLCVLCRLGERQVFVRLHHAVWAICKGRFPEQQIDHINGNKQDNRIENLREVSPSENNMNMLYPWRPNAKTGLPGVYKHGSGYQIKVGRHLYHFRDKYEAFYHLTLLGRRYKCAPCGASETLR
jgi:hypothetical protein